MNIAEKRRNTLINCIYFVVIAAIYYLSIKYAFWTLAPFVIALIIAMVLQKPIRFISKKTKIKKSILGAVAVLLIITLILSAIVFVGYRIGSEFRGFGEFIVHKVSDLPNSIVSVERWILNRIKFLPDGLEKTATDAITEFSDRLLIAAQSEGSVSGMGSAITNSVDFSFLATPLGGIWSTAKQIPSVLVATLITINAS